MGMPKKRIVYAGILMAAVILSGLVYVSQTGGQRPLTDMEDGFWPSEGEAKESLGGEPQEIQEEKIYIHVCGEVVSPGVYELAAGSRTFDAVTAAGGFTELAAGDYLNLAEILQDGEKVVVPDREMLKDPEFLSEIQGGTGSDGALVNLNKADLSQLMTLPGIGEAKAKSIIKYREDIGFFKQIEDIMNISGIKESAFEKLKEYVTVK